MQTEKALNAIQIVIDVANHVGDGSIEKYFNGFELDGTDLYEFIEAVASLEELRADNKDLPELEKEEIIFTTLFWIKTAINHDKNAIRFFKKVNCKKHTDGMGYPAYIESILYSKKNAMTNLFAEGGNNKD